MLACSPVSVNVNSSKSGRWSFTVAVNVNSSKSGRWSFTVAVNVNSSKSGHWSFTVAEPRICNNLPHLHLRHSELTPSWSFVGCWIKTYLLCWRRILRKIFIIGSFRQHWASVPITFIGFNGATLRPVWARVLCSGGVSAVKDPGHFEVRKSSSHVTGVPDTTKGSPDLSDLTDLHYTTAAR